MVLLTPWMAGDESLLRTAALAPAPKPLAASASAATALEAMVAAAEVDPEAAAVATETESAAAATLRLDAGATSPGQVTAPSSYELNALTPHSAQLYPDPDLTKTTAGLEGLLLSSGMCYMCVLGTASWCSRCRGRCRGACLLQAPDVASR